MYSGNHDSSLLSEQITIKLVGNVRSYFNKNFLRSCYSHSAIAHPLKETHASRWKVETEIIIWCGQYFSCKLNHLEGSIELEI